MTDYVTKGGTGRIGSEATILLDGSGRQITLPKGMRQKLKEVGWKSGPVFLFYDSRKNILKVCPIATAYEIIGNAAGLI